MRLIDRFDDGFGNAMTFAQSLLTASTSAGTELTFSTPGGVA